MLPCSHIGEALSRARVRGALTSGTGRFGLHLQVAQVRKTELKDWEALNDRVNELSVTLALIKKSPGPAGPAGPTGVMGPPGDIGPQVHLHILRPLAPPAPFPC